ncbi:MAG: RNA polymerase sigma factor [Chitinophagaceae bacterium]
MTEALLINACLQKNMLAQRELYNLYSPKMLGICYRYAYCREDAEDMLQEGFVKIFNQLSTFENRGSFEGWMKRVIVNTCINFLKRNKKFNENLSLDAAYHVEYKEESVVSKLQGKQIIECIRLLPIGYRTILNLNAIEGYSHKEIASLLEIEESTSRSQLTRAKIVLENILIKRGIIENTKKAKELALFFGK